MTDSSAARSPRASDPTLRRFALCWLAAMLLMPLAAPALDFSAGLDAYRSGDHERAATIWRELGEAGDALAQGALGSLYFKGEGVEQDFAESTRWFQRAAEQGNALAQFNLGNAYRHGRGVAKDDRKTALWWRRAAEQNLAEAQFNLALYYYYGRGVKQDHEAAVQWIQRAAGNGHERAKELLAKSGLPQPETAAASAPAGETTGAEAKGRIGNSVGWIREQPPAHYTVQILIHEDAAGAEAALREYALDGPVAVFPYINPKGKPRVAAVLGSYRSPSAARGALGGLPPGLKRGQPWVRKFASIQALIRDAPSGEEAAAPTALAKAPTAATATPTLAGGVTETPSAAAPPEAVPPPTTVPPGAVPPAAPRIEVASDELRWLLEQPPEHLTVQILIHESAAGAEAVLRKHTLEGPVTVFPYINPKGKPRVAAVLGSYRSPSAARRALRGLPPGLKRGQPWVRTFASIHALIGDAPSKEAATAPAAAPEAPTLPERVAETPSRGAVPEAEVPPAAMPPSATPPAAEPIDLAKDRLQWLREQSPNHYTIQILLEDDEEAARAALREHTFNAPVAMFAYVNADGKWRVAAVHGSYASPADAARALRKLPRKVRRAKPWVRKFATFQRRMLDPAKASKAAPTGLTGNPSRPDEAPAATPAPESTRASEAGSGAVVDSMRWLRQQPPSHYTLQLLVSANAQGTDAMARKHGFRAPVATFGYTSEEGFERHALVHGSYPSRNSAQRAVADLPATLGKLEPLIRRFSSIQAQLGE